MRMEGRKRREEFRVGEEGGGERWGKGRRYGAGMRRRVKRSLRLKVRGERTHKSTLGKIYNGSNRGTREM